jgi:hypothetical protein
MALKLVDQGEVDALKAFLNIDPAEDLVLRLYQNNKVPADADTEANYTEADFVGYAEIALDADDWTVTPGNPTEAEQSDQTFTSTAAAQDQDIYGYYVVGASSGRLKWAERFADGPYDIQNIGDAITVTPVFTGRSAN